MRVRFLGLASAALACVSIATSVSATADRQTLGAGVTLEKVTPIADLLAQPSQLEGQTVRVDGIVTAVCAHMGCWMALAPVDAPDAKQTVRLKVEDGAIVFPVSAKGRHASAQGVVERLRTDDAESQEAAGEHAKAAAKTGTAASAAQWQIKATGAVID